MTHKHRNKQIQRVKKKYKNLAGIVAAATILSTTMLPGLPTSIAHASASSNTSNMSATTSQQVAKTSDSGIQINFNSKVLPTNELKAQNQNPRTTTETKQENKASRPSSDVGKAPVTTPKTTEQAKPNVQPDPNIGKAPTTIPKTTAQANPNVQPDPNIGKAPVTTPKPIEQANPNAQPDPNVGKAPVTTPKPIEQANPNAQPDPNIGKAPVTTPKPIEQANPNAQPDPNVGKAPVTTPKPIEQANPNAQPDPNITKTSAGNAPADYKQVLDIKATAYAPGPHDNDQWGNKTFIGSQVRPGIIAVDPNVIPLGSKVYIQYPDGHGEYAIAEDTGGAIKGNRVDIAKWTVNEAKDFGIQNVKVFVVSTPEKV